MDRRWRRWPLRPHIASATQSVLATLIVLGFLVTGKDPYGDMYTLLAILGTMAILIVQALCGFSVVRFFHIRPAPGIRGNWFRTLLAPLLGGLGMIYVVYLLWSNMAFAAGSAVNSLLFRLIPYIVLILFLAGGAIALYFRLRDHQKYEIIDRIVMHEQR